MSKTSPVGNNVLDSVGPRKPLHKHFFVCTFQRRHTWAKQVWSQAGAHWKKTASRRAFCKRLRCPYCPTKTAQRKQITPRRWSPTTCCALATRESDYATVVKAILVSSSGKALTAQANDLIFIRTGGPLKVERDDKRYELIGIVSWGNG